VKPPVALRVGFWVAIVISVALTAVFVLTAASVLPPIIAGAPVSRAAWWRISPILLLAAMLAAAIAFGIRRRRPWSRHLVLALWVLIAVGALTAGLSGDIPRQVLWRALAEPAILIVLCGWYLYGKTNVVEYFRGNPRGASGVFSADEGGRKHE
jgi:uncharacterized membrane protein YhaH (DUF805 family)